jgi:hypothetical protein
LDSMTTGKTALNLLGHFVLEIIRWGLRCWFP